MTPNSIVLGKRKIGATKSLKKHPRVLRPEELTFNNLFSGSGVAVIPIKYEGNIENDIQMSIARQRDIPDLLTCKQTGAVGGGFSALGNADSFHDKFPRDIRQLVYNTIIEHLKANRPDLVGNTNIEYLVDRMLLRPEGVGPTAENWHRDMTPMKPNACSNVSRQNRYLTGALESDIIFGGWVNCNLSEKHRFLCVPGSNSGNSTTTEHSGFVLLNDSGIQEQKDALDKAACIVEIPPGHLILFEQSLIHAVNPEKAKTTLYRVFVGFRITDDTEPLVKNIEKVLKEGQVVPIKSGQLPEMFPAMWPLFWKDRLVSFSLNFPPYMKEPRNMKMKRNKETCLESHNIVRKIGVALSPEVPYTDVEIQLCVPHRLV